MRTRGAVLPPAYPEQSLTPREQEIARLVAVGLSNPEIARVLFISAGTVKVHLHNIYEKLRLGGRVALALYARRSGLFDG